MKRLIIDLDNTICKSSKSDYKNAKPIHDVVNKIKHYKKCGFEIVIHTSRNVRTFDGNVGKIAAYTLPIIIKWLNKYKVPYDEIHIGKPWCGLKGFYVDDRAVRPDEFIKLSHTQLLKKISSNK